jgi:hypothetical protein
MTWRVRVSETTLSQHSEEHKVAQNNPSGFVNLWESFQRKWTQGVPGGQPVDNHTVSFF